MVRASIIGANGYTGLELMRILSSHKGVELVHCAARKQAGERIRDVFPELSFLGGATFSDAQDFARLSSESDVIFSCLPHASSAEVVLPYLDKGLRVVDLSADFRYKSLKTYEDTYKVVHPAPQLLDSAVYGLPEIYFDSIKHARVVGNPGCYTTSSILPLYPLIKEGLVQSQDIIIDAKSGTSGAGRKADTSLIFSEVAESFKAYAVTTHRHTSEIEEVLTLAGGHNTVVAFTPHLLPVRRGILSTIYAKVDPSIAQEDIDCAYQKYYADKPFVEIMDTLPELKSVVGTNVCRIGFRLDYKNNRLIIISCLDNLIKGASGQAVQNMNIMFGLPQTQGLKEG